MLLRLGAAGWGAPAHAALPPGGAGPPPAYLVLCGAGLEAQGAAWAEHRRADGWAVRLERVDPPGADVAPARAALRERIARRFREHRRAGGGPFAVLLLGDADLIPTWHDAQPDASLRASDGVYASDHEYQRLDEATDLPCVALGRVPARSPAEAALVLEKVKRYEAAPPGPWRRRVMCAAGEGRFGALDLLLEQMFAAMVGGMVPEPFDLTLTYAKASSVFCPPPERLSGTVAGQVGGAILFNYIGHGSATSLDDLRVNGRRYPILRGDDLPGAPAAAEPTIALLTCCSAGWFDLPQGRHSLAEAMLFHPAGPVAVVAGSRPTHPYANTLLQKDFVRVMLAERTSTLGELDLRVTRAMLEVDAADRSIDFLAGALARAQGWPSSLADLRRMHARLYNLLGDPALRITYPGAVEELGFHEGRLRGRVPGMRRGRVTVTIETATTSLARPDALRPVAGDDDPEFAAKAAANYAEANDRVLWRGEAAVHDGAFEIDVGKLPARAALAKCYALGEDESLAPVDAAGALRLRP